MNCELGRADLIFYFHPKRTTRLIQFDISCNKSAIKNSTFTCGLRKVDQSQVSTPLVTSTNYTVMYYILSLSLSNGIHSHLYLGSLLSVSFCRPLHLSRMIGDALQKICHLDYSPYWAWSNTCYSLVKLVLLLVVHLFSRLFGRN